MKKNGKAPNPVARPVRPAAARTCSMEAVLTTTSSELRDSKRTGDLTALPGLAGKVESGKLGNARDP
jgi:hypothetical protein